METLIPSQAPRSLLAATVRTELLYSLRAFLRYGLAQSVHAGQKTLVLTGMSFPSHYIDRVPRSRTGFYYTFYVIKPIDHITNVVLSFVFNHLETAPLPASFSSPH